MCLLKFVEKTDLCGEKMLLKKVCVATRIMEEAVQLPVLYEHNKRAGPPGLLTLAVQRIKTLQFPNQKLTIII